jgi:protein Tex
MLEIAGKITQELKVKLNQVEQTIDLIDGGSTVPFIARYRKEVTGGLDDTQLRKLHERLFYLRELQERQEVILKSIKEQDKLTPELEKSIYEADTKTRLEDLYLPFRPKRRTKAQLAREAGLEPLAQGLWQNPTQDPETLASDYLNPEHKVDDVKAALDGARQILMEQFAEDANLLEKTREYLWNNALLSSKVVEQQKAKGAKYSDYFDYSEQIKKIPSHRALALFRGRREGFLLLNLTNDENPQYGEDSIKATFDINDKGRLADAWLGETVKWAWKIKIFTKLELELMTRLREMAEEEAIRVFADNLKDLLLAAPAGAKVVMGLDPGIRTGVKVVVVDITGKLLDFTTVYPLAPQNKWHQSITELAKLSTKFNVDLISIGNGTGSRETDRLVAEMAKMYPDLALSKIMVNEAGASVYSASEFAAKEFPDLDVSLRGAVSIARRLQDPLAELVKIEPKSIGVGQYQHDVNQTRLAKCLEGTVEDCVNAVGVDVNTASAALLKRVSGLNETLAKNVVSYRDEHGAFKSRDDLKAIPRMGEKSFEQSAGFLRISNGENPLDSSSVHPEAYPIVTRILKDKDVGLKDIIGSKDLLNSINAKDYIDNEHGLPTILDIIKELEKPGRDPRGEFKTAHFKEGIEEISDLEENMLLEGVVSNVTNFGAFVDIGVHQDGLVHISALTNKFVNDPRKVVKTGDIVKVRVVEIDKERKRIGLSMRLDEKVQAPKEVKPKKKAKPQKLKTKPIKPIKPIKSGKPPINTAMADAFAKLKKGD